MCQSVKDETLLLQYNPNNTQAFVPKKLKWNEITQWGQWELKDLTLPKPIKPLTTPSAKAKRWLKGNVMKMKSKKRDLSSAPGEKIGETTSKLKFSSKVFSTLSSSSSSYKCLDQPFIIPINAAKSNTQLATPTEIMLKEIQIRLDKLNINGINQTKNQIQTITKGKS